MEQPLVILLLDVTVQSHSGYAYTGLVPYEALGLLGQGEPASG